MYYPRVPLNRDALIVWPFEERVQSYGERDSILYGLGLGLGSDPSDASQLRFVQERDLCAVPTMAVVLGHPGNFWGDPATGINYELVLHGEQRLTLHQALPPAATVRARNRVAGIVDKGRNALVYLERTLTDEGSGSLLATQTTTVFCRDAGGYQGPSDAPLPAHPIPDRPRDLAIDHPTFPQQALIYRLSGDLNPLHSDPVVAARAGFPRPILHGLCTYGIAGYAILAGLCGGDPARLRRLDARFSSPAFPGEIFRTEIWHEGLGAAAYRCSVPARQVVVIDNGYCEFEVAGAA